MEISQPAAGASVPAALAQARARFNAFGTSSLASPATPSLQSASQPISSGAPAVPSTTSAQAAPRVAETAEQQSARIKSELASITIRLPRHASMAALIKAYSKAMRQPGLSKDTIARLGEFQNQLLESYRQTMTTIINMGQ